MKTNTKKICILGMGIALYVVFAAIVNIPLFNHIKTDLGYIVFGVYLMMFGWQASIVGVIGCMLESMLFSGWFPLEWMAGQLFIGIMCGICYKKTKNIVLQIGATIIAVFIGIAVIKTGMAFLLYGMSIAVKFPKNVIVFVADVIPMIVGVIMSKYLQRIINKNNK